MTNITRLHHALPLSPSIVKAINEMDESLCKAIDSAKAAGNAAGFDHRAASWSKLIQLAL